MIKKTLKFTLCALLLGAGVKAFADGEVRLNNGNIIPWSQFVNDLKNPPTKVDGVTLPADAQVYKDKEAAEALLKEKEDAVKPLAQDSIDAAGKLTEVETNKENYIKENVTPLENTYNNYVNTVLPGKKASLSDKEAQRTTLNSQLQAAQANLTSLQAELNSLNSELTLVEKKIGLNTDTKTVTNTVTDSWLQEIYTDAKNFESEFASNTDKTEIYYLYEKKAAAQVWEQPTYNLTISFIAPSNTSGWSGPIYQSGLKDLYTKLATEDKITSVNNLYVYLGSQYAKTGSDTKKVGSNIALGSILEDVKESIQAATADSRFQTTTTTTVTSYIDEELNTTLQNEKAGIESSITSTNSSIRAAQTTVNNLNKQLNGVHEEGKEEVKGVNDEITELQNDIDTLEDTTIPAAEKAWKEAQTEADTKYASEIETAQKGVEDANAAVAAARAAVTAQEKNVAAAEAAIESALADAQKAALNTLLAAYNQVYLEKDINVESATGVDYAGRIYGQGHIINIPSNVYLFNDFTGRLNNAAVNGNLAHEFVTTNFKNVAVWTGAGTNPGRFYDEEANRTNYSTLGSLGFAVRDIFGVNFTDKNIVTLGSYTKVYSVSVYNGPENAVQQNYVTCNKDKEMFGKDGQVTIPVNNFAKSATDDIASLKIPNVYYVVDGNNECANVVIEGEKVGEGDDKAYKSFYCPEDIKATSLTLNRSLKAGMNSVCLPFVLNRAYGGINAVCTYNQETKDGFVFTFIEGNVPANTPVLLFADNAISEISLSDIQINATDASQITKPTVSKTGKSACYGTFKSVLAGEFEGQTSAESVYGLNAGKFQKAGASATFAPFRVAIVNYAESASVAAAPRRIIIKNEDGDDITDLIIDEDLEISGVTDIEEDALAFNVSGGQGEIVITSDADYGKVVVYTMDGKAVESANVVAGTTTVNVQKGLYIVMGKKVMVK